MQANPATPPFWIPAFAGMTVLALGTAVLVLENAVLVLGMTVLGWDDSACLENW